MFPNSAVVEYEPAFEMKTGAFDGSGAGVGVIGGSFVAVPGVAVIVAESCPLSGQDEGFTSL
jgi:hypothetical protein